MVAILIRLLILVAFLIIVVLVVAGLYLDSIIKTGVETIGPKITGTTVSLDDVDISVLSGRGTLKGLVVGNPKGFYTDSAYHLVDTKVKIDLTSIVSGKVIIEEIVIDSPEITYEVNFSGNNLDKIQHNVEVFRQKYGLKESATSDPQTSGLGARKVQINHFIMKNGTLRVSASLLRGRALTFALDDVHLRDIGKDSGGVTVDHATSQVLAGTNKAIFKAVPRSSKVLERRLQKVGKAVESLKGTAEKSASNVLRAVIEFFQKVGERIDSLFEWSSPYTVGDSDL